MSPASTWGGRHRTHGIHLVATTLSHKSPGYFKSPVNGGDINSPVAQASRLWLTATTPHADTSSRTTPRKRPAARAARNRLPAAPRFAPGTAPQPPICICICICTASVSARPTTCASLCVFLCASSASLAMALLSLWLAFSPHPKRTATRSAFPHHQRASGSCMHSAVLGRDRHHGCIAPRGVGRIARSRGRPYKTISRAAILRPNPWERRHPAGISLTMYPSVRFSLCASPASLAMALLPLW